ncbi:leucyl aminopeptidase [Micrococcoides hystricis]|uniref:Probable cytosol aminopeptidase n=1 Tax=Micrococcoides hystricis TaxID=1572761 RepID=A0ABV6P8Z6_9MICC
MKKIDISLPTVKATPASLSKAKSEGLVVAVAQGENGPQIIGDALDKKDLAALENSLASLGVTGATDQVVQLPGMDTKKFPVLILTGVGKAVEEGYTPETLRRAAGAVTRTTKGISSLTFALPAAEPEQFQAVAEGALLGTYRFTAYKSENGRNNDAEPKLETIEVATELSSKISDGLVTAATTGAEAVALAKNLINTPPSHLFPETFAATASEVAKNQKLKIKVWDEKDLHKDGFGGHIGVGKGSVNGPRLVKIEYRPARATGHVALVGKGITFDTGGISLKPAASMMTMKSDMSGAAAVLAAISGIAARGAKVNVTAWLAMAENMPSATAIKPSDVITMYGGKTVEVMNTDAEGRLVLADAIVAAGEDQPDAIIDIATLTGAQMVALGTRTCGVMGDEAVRQRVVDAAESTGELVWPMPIPEELKPSLKSQVADLSNIGERFGGMMTAAAFLREFVGTDKAGATIPWAHIDIAGPSFNEGSPYGYTGKDATGVMVRTLMSVAESYAN